MSTEIRPPRDSREAREILSKAAAYDRLVRWLDSLEAMGICGNFVSAGDVRNVLEGKHAQ